ncbi:MAG TPA: phospholipase D-like domain-containing protein [Acidobacteriota bacterium]|nr:phospholipase D-like domain-containing protein [Acidobacteriota bacterium]
MDSSLFLVLATIALAFQTLTIYLFLFEPGLEYRISKRPKIPSASDDCIPVLEALSSSPTYKQNKIEVLTNGEAYYEAELASIQEAIHSIHLEAYIFNKGRLTKRFLAALTERARAGVAVRVVADAIGNFLTPDSYFDELRNAGGKVCWYHPFRLHLIPRLNNRTHRELIIIDGKVGFIGGSGFADHWAYGKNGHPAWRDTMVRVTGPAVRGLQATFTENWLESSGEIITCKDCFPELKPAGDVTAFVVDSSPSAGRSTRSRIVFQTLLACASKSIAIATPYFLPDAGARKEMIDAVKERGVKIRIITPGHKSDHLLTRHSSRRIYGDLLQAGIRIFEYQPSMMHAKIMVIDDVCSIVGSTNFDNRSFGLNDETNLIGFDRALAERLLEDFERDIANSEEITLEKWKKRPIAEKVFENAGRILERQQ